MRSIIFWSELFIKHIQFVWKKNVYFESFFFWRMEMFACSSQNLSMQPVTALIHNYSRIADYIHWICNEYQRTKRFNARTMNREECINWNTIAVVYVYIHSNCFTINQSQHVCEYTFFMHMFIVYVLHTLFPMKWRYYYYSMFVISIQYICRLILVSIDSVDFNILHSDLIQETAIKSTKR